MCHQWKSFYRWINFLKGLQGSISCSRHVRYTSPHIIGGIEADAFFAAAVWTLQRFKKVEKEKKESSIGVRERMEIQARSTLLHVFRNWLRGWWQHLIIFVAQFRKRPEELFLRMYPCYIEQEGDTIESNKGTSGWMHGMKTWGAPCGNEFDPFWELMHISIYIRVSHDRPWKVKRKWLWRSLSACAAQTESHPKVGILR